MRIISIVYPDKTKIKISWKQDEERALLELYNTQGYLQETRWTDFTNYTFKDMIARVTKQDQVIVTEYLNSGKEINYKKNNNINNK